MLMKNKLLWLSLFVLVGCGETSNRVEANINVPVLTQSDQEKAVARHNEIRKEVFSNSDLIWSVEVAQSAQAYADSLAQSGKWEHDTPANNLYGENLFTASYQVDYVDAINSWYGEKPYYNYADNRCQSSKVCGHYTQMIWKNSTEVGCGIAQYTTGSYKDWLVVVCRYNPPGNYIGEKPY